MNSEKPNSGGPPTQRRLLDTAKSAQKMYGHYPNVIGVGVGTKYSNRRPAGDTLCIHFYVRNKRSRIARKDTLPKFVYGRKRNGSVDYSQKIPTDVIELKHLKFACKSGTEIDVIGETGTLTLLFRNKLGGQDEYYLITCAHVAGDVRQSPPVDPAVESSCCRPPPVFANTIVNSTQKNESVDYDIALARVTPECSPQPELQVLGSSATLKRFLSSDSIHPGLTLDCAFARSNTVSATVSSFRTSLPLALDGRVYQVNNLFLINRPPRPGDSGGLLYDGSTAVGLLVGMTDGWGLFQPLDEAFAHLQSISPVPIQCF